ncbi:MAG: amino acid ABC transporter permease [Planctomycetota bacterium]|jgi:polar amino acid transport system permease protein
MDGDTLRALLDGYGLTLVLFAVSLLLSMVLGIFVALGRLARPAWVRLPVTAFVELVRGVPLLVLLMWVYFGVFSMGAVTWLFEQMGRPNQEIPAAILAFALCYSAFIGETYRAGIQSVDRGQTEAARSLGLSSRQAFRFVVLPQAIRNVLPALGNESIALFKDTSLAMVIAIPELMMRGKQAAARDFRTLEVYSVVAIIYLVTVIAMTRVQRHLERRFGAGTSA